MRRYCRFLAVGFWLALAGMSQAATLTVSNYNANFTGLYGIAGASGILIPPGVGGGVIGRMASLTDGEVSGHVASGNYAALNADFQVFGEAFPLEFSSEGPDGAFETSVSHDTRASVNGFGGSPIYVWLYKGASRTAATEHFLVKLNLVFPTDPENLPPLGPIDVAVRPGGTIATIFVGNIGPGTHDYGLPGSPGPLPVLRMRGPNAVPVADAKSIDVLVGVPFNGSVTASDANLDELTFSKVSDPVKGSLVFNADGTFSYTANAGTSGQDSFTFKANDGLVDSNIATVTVHIQNTAPVADDKVIGVLIGVPFNGSVTASDANLDDLTFSKVSDPVKGGLIFNADGTFSYTANAGTSGQDSFTFKANDGLADSNIATVMVHIENTAPVADATSIDAFVGVPFNGNVTAGDVDMDDLVFSKVSDPVKGSLVFNADGTFTYTAGVGASGQDSFTFKANDGLADSNIATVTVHIQNTAPVVEAKSIDALPAVPLNSSVTASDANWDDLTFSKVSDPAKGSLVLNADGTFTYTANAGTSGQDSFTFKANDGLADSNTATVTVHISAEKMTLGNLIQTYTGGPLTVSVAGVPPGNLGDVAITYNGSEEPPVNAGKYDVVAELGAQRKTGKLIIAKAPLTVTADDQRKLIGQPNPPLTFSYSGFLGPDTADSVFPDPATQTAKPPVISTTAKENSPGGSYPIKLSGGAAANYRLVFAPGILTVDSFAGKYEVLLESPDTGRAIAKVELTVAKTAKNGRMSATGKLWTSTETAALAIKGSLDVDPRDETAVAAWTLTKGDNTYELAVVIPLDEDGFAAELSLNGDPAGAGSGGRRVFVPAKGQIITHAGAHTVILAPGVPVPAFDDTANPEPQGAGHATASISAKAVLKLAGVLADGTKITASLMPDADAGYRLFLNPYKRINSYLSGGIVLAPHPDLPGRRHVASGSGTSLTWIKAAKLQDKSYRNGIDLLDCALTLDPWRKPAKAAGATPAITLLDELGLTADTVITVQHSDFPSIVAALPGEALLGSNNKLTIVSPPENEANWQITLNTANGTFKGKFTLNNEKKRTVNFTGVLRRKLSTAPGDFIGRGNFQLPALPSDATNEVQSGGIQFLLAD